MSAASRSARRPGANRNADIIGIAPGFGAEVDMVPRMMGERLESLRERAVIACPGCHFFVMRYASIAIPAT